MTWRKRACLSMFFCCRAVIYYSVLSQNIKIPYFLSQNDKIRYFLFRNVKTWYFLSGNVKYALRGNKSEWSQTARKPWTPQFVLNCIYIYLIYMIYQKFIFRDPNKKANSVRWKIRYWETADMNAGYFKVGSWERGFRKHQIRRICHRPSQHRQ